MTLEELREKERLQRMQGQKANIFGLSKTPEQPSPTELDWKRALSEAPVIGKDNDEIGVDNYSDAVSMQSNENARQLADKITEEVPAVSEPKNKLGATALSALAGLGKSMSRGQDIPAMPKLNPLKTIEPQDVMEARRKALMQLSVRKK